VLKNKNWVMQAYKDYSLGKQTLAELSLKYNKSIATIRKYFEQTNLCHGEIKAPDEPINLLFDATFFTRSYGLLVFRANKKNLYWLEIDGEKIEYIAQGLSDLKNCNYIFKSFTIDGRRGVINLLKSKFPNIPIQLCQFHQIAIIRRYTTNNPKTDCGKELKELMKTLTISTRERFENNLNKLVKKYESFLKEKNENNQFKHRRLRSAFRSLKTNLPYLFTCLDYPKLNIPNTTNSCDGSFAHWKQKVKIHRGLSKERRLKMINYLSENS
jgi:hypothetical protein